MIDTRKFSSTKFFQGLSSSGVDTAGLENLFWPTIKDDAWKYSSLSFLAEQEFKPALLVAGQLPEEARTFLLPEAINLVFLNGVFLGASSDIGKVSGGVTVLTGEKALSAIARETEQVVRETRNDAKLFLELNRLCSQDALWLDIPAGVKAQGPFHILYLLDGSAGKIAAFPRAFIKMGASAQRTLLETFVSLDQEECFNNPCLDIVLAEGAQLERVQVCQDSDLGFHIGSTRVWQSKDSRFKTFTFTGGAKIFRDNLSVILDGEGGEVVLNGLHVLKGDRHADSHTFVEHVAPNTRSNQLYKCVLEERSHSVFNGRIFVGREAQLTNSYQLNRNLLLSSECRVDTKPQLEIGADDVKCTHGATIGQLDDDEIFYLQTRGINREEAGRMLIRGFMEDVLGQVDNPVLRAAVTKMAVLSL